MLKISMSV